MHPLQNDMIRYYSYKAHPGSKSACLPVILSSQKSLCIANIQRYNLKPIYEMHFEILLWTSFYGQTISPLCCMPSNGMCYVLNMGFHFGNNFHMTAFEIVWMPEEMLPASLFFAIRWRQSDYYAGCIRKQKHRTHGWRYVLEIQ